jgi:hypothetical protein
MQKVKTGQRGGRRTPEPVTEEPEFTESPFEDNRGQVEPSKSGGTSNGKTSDDTPSYTPGYGREVLIDGEIFYILEGDIAADIDQRQVYAELRALQEAQRDAVRQAEQTGFVEARIAGLSEQASALVGIRRDGKLLRWAPGTVLSYCVLEQTFPRRDWYEEVVENVALATSDWEETCGVKFQYRGDVDGSSSLRPPEVLFPVRLINAGGAFIAAAFFPYDPVSRRRLLIDPSYFTSRFDQVGVLRHELGHTLGFRHEQLRPEAPPICPDEDTTGTFDLTLYDPKSVMHYFCGGVGSRELAISEVDRSGAQILYGPPLTSYELVEV